MSRSLIGGRLWLKVVAVAIMTAVLGLMGAPAGPAAAHQDPSGCTTNGLDISLTPSTSTVQMGDTITYTAVLDNTGATNCSDTDVNAALHLPDGSAITLLTNASITAGDTITCPGDAECVSAGPYSYTVAEADVTGSESGCPPGAPAPTPPFFVTAYADFSGTVHINPTTDVANSVTGCKSAPAQVVTPSTNVNASTDVAAIVVGQSVQITVTEANDGETNLTNAHVDLTGGAISGTLTLNSSSSGFSGDDGDGILEPGETWQWQVSDSPTSNATYTAIGHGTAPNGDDVTWCEPGTAPANTICDEDERATTSVEVSKLTPTVVTTIVDSNGSPITSAPIGTSVHDTVHVSGSGPVPTGDVTFHLFATMDCTGTPTDQGPVALDASGNASSSATTVPASGLSYSASYAGDTVYTAGDSACEPLTPEKLTPTVVTTIVDSNGSPITSATAGSSVHDTVHVSGSGPVPTGNVTFHLFASTDCSGTPTDQGPIALDASGNASSSATTVPATGLSYKASYAGDSVYSSGDSACEPLTVEQANQGCTPGFWKNHTNVWTTYQPGQLVSTVFTIPSGYNSSFSSETLLDALQGGGGPGIDGAATILLRAAVAGLLNAADTNINYPLSEAQIISQVNAALATKDRSQILSLASTLDQYNNLENNSVC